MVEQQTAELDDAQELLDHDDQKELKKKADETKSIGTEVALSVKQVARRREAIAKSSSSGSAEPAAKKRKKQSTDELFRRRVKIPEGPLTQPEVKLLCLPGIYIWRNSAAGAWCAKHPPLKQCCKAWVLYWHRESALMCVQELWKQHAELGYTDRCFVDGSVVVVPSAGSGTSSSTERK